MPLFIFFSNLIPLILKVTRKIGKELDLYEEFIIILKRFIMFGWVIGMFSLHFPLHIGF